MPPSAEMIDHSFGIAADAGNKAHPRDDNARLIHTSGNSF